MGANSVEFARAAAPGRGSVPVADDNPLPVYLANPPAGIVAGGGGSGSYEAVAASQTDQILGATGAVGDWLGTLIITVGTAATAAVSIKDGNGSAIPILPNSPGGGVGVYVVPINARAVNATTPGWKVTTSAGSTVLATGSFT